MLPQVCLWVGVPPCGLSLALRSNVDNTEAPCDQRALQRVEHSCHGSHAVPFQAELSILRTFSISSRDVELQKMSLNMQLQGFQGRTKTLLRNIGGLSHKTVHFPSTLREPSEIHRVTLHGGGSVLGVGAGGSPHSSPAPLMAAGTLDGLAFVSVSSKH